MVVLQQLAASYRETSSGSRSQRSMWTWGRVRGDCPVCPVCLWGFYSPCHTNHPGRPYRLKQVSRPQCPSCAEFQKRYEVDTWRCHFVFHIRDDLWICGSWYDIDASLTSMTTAILSSAVQMPMHVCIWVAGWVFWFPDFTVRQQTNCCSRRFVHLDFFLHVFFFLNSLTGFRFYCGRPGVVAGRKPEDTWEGQHRCSNLPAPCCAFPLRYRWSVWSNWGVRKLVLRSKLALLIAWMCFLRPQCPSCQRLQELVAQEKNHAFRCQNSRQRSGPFRFLGLASWNPVPISVFGALCPKTSGGNIKQNAHK